MGNETNSNRESAKCKLRDPSSSRSKQMATILLFGGCKTLGFVVRGRAHASGDRAPHGIAEGRAA